MAEKSDDRNEGKQGERRPMAPQPAKGDGRDQAHPPDHQNHPGGEGRDVPPPDRPRGTESPWLGGG